jgi:hypothetical protein
MFIFYFQNDLTTDTHLWFYFQIYELWKMVWLITRNFLSLFPDRNFVPRSCIRFLTFMFKPSSFLLTLHSCDRASWHVIVHRDMWPYIVTNVVVITSIGCTNFTNLFCHETLRFGQLLCPSSGDYSLYTQQWYMSYRFVDSFRAVPSSSCSKAVYKPAWHIPLLSVQWIISWW